MALTFKAYTASYPPAAQAYATLPLPAGVAAGDLLIATFAYGDIAGSPPAAYLTPPAGWQAVGQYTMARLRGETFWRVAGANEPASYTWNGAAYLYLTGAMLAYSGSVDLDASTVITTAPLNYIAGSSNVYTNMAQAAGERLVIHCLHQSSGQMFGAPSSLPPNTTVRVPYGTRGLLVCEQLVADQDWAWGQAYTSLSEYQVGSGAGAHSILFVAPPSKRYPQAVRGFLGQLFVAYIAGHALKVDRYSDAWPEIVEGTATVEAAGAESCALGYRRCGILDLIYEQAGAIKRRESRDGGRTWEVADTIASGYKYPAPCMDESGGIWPIMLFGSGSWYLTVGTLDAAGVWAFTAPVEKITGAADSPGQLQRRADGLWQFVYTDTAGDNKAVYCRDLGADGVGTWG